MSCTAHLVPSHLRATLPYPCVKRQPFQTRSANWQLVPASRQSCCLPSGGRVTLQPLSAAQDSEFDSAEAEGIEEEPEDARGAIAVGLKYYKAGDYQKALELFGRAPALPGTGTKRFRDKPPESSDGEKISALYNIACCHGQLSRPTESLLALAEVLKLGYNDINQIRSDPDLEPTREDSRFEKLLLKYKKSSRGGLLDNLMRGI